LETDSASGASWARQTLLWRPSAPTLSEEGTLHQKLASCSRFLTGGLEEEGHTLIQAVADHMLMCFRSHDPSISLEPAVQGPVEGFAEAARDGVEDVAHVIAERFECEPEDA
jgi:hypothetical protein